MKNSSFHVHQSQFEGPLDLLLDLIEREKLPINKISLSRVTDEFLREIKALTVIDQEALAEFLVVAAQLMLLKSRSLLPHLALTVEEEASIGDLEQRLEQYKKIKELSADLRLLERRRQRIYAREGFLGLQAIFYPPPRLNASALADAFGAILNSIPKLAELAEEKLKKVISLEEKIRYIQKSLSLRLERMFSELVQESKEKVEIVVSFLAILELSKQKLVALDQAQLFGDIRISQHSKPPDL